MNQVNLKSQRTTRANSRNGTDMKSSEDYLTPNSQSTAEDFPKAARGSVAALIQNLQAPNQDLRSSNPFPLPGLINESRVKGKSPYPNRCQIGSQESTDGSKKLTRPPPVPPHPPPRPGSSHSSSSLSSSITSRSAQSTSSSREGTVPDFVDIEQGLQNREWFHGNLTREAAEDLLFRLNKKGAFLIRYKQQRTQNIPYTLSVFCDKVYHLQIRYLVGDNRYALGREKTNEMTFKGLQALVNHHKDKPLQLIRIEDDSLSGSTKLMCSPRKQ